ncbi:hypothetical protein F5B19DRAFT_503407 [Rostrohypoxylon terebratum]|nr:hypothetical protein F5B19DRAFT_503407 [Rostrohypoxylon terebratum]
MDVLLTWNHPQFDGAGAKVFHEDFLEMLNSAKKGAYERKGLNGDILTLPQEPPTTQLYSRSCRQNKTTITGLINELALIAFSSRLDSTAAPAFPCATIIDHRRNLPPAPPDVPLGRSDRVISNYVTDWQQTMSNIVKKKRQFSWLVTNVGVLEGNRLGTITGGDVDSDDNQR